MAEAVKTEVVLVVAVHQPRELLLQSLEDVVFLQKRLCILFVVGACGHDYIQDGVWGVDAECDVRRPSVKEAKIVVELERLQMVDQGLELVDEPGVTPEEGRERIFCRLYKIILGIENNCASCLEM